MDEKGAIVTKVMIWTIIVIAGFVILLIVFARLSLQEEADQAICHQSVVFRATLPVTELGEQYIPLKCETEKKCVSSGFGGSCDDLDNEKGVKKVKVENLEEVEKLISRDIMNCWSMMGEGKVSLFSQFFAQQFGFGGVYPSCVICTRTAFDRKNLEDKEINMSKIDIAKYMETHYFGDTGKTYLEYLAGEDGKVSIDPDLNELKKTILELSDEIKNIKDIDEKSKNAAVNLNEEVEKSDEWVGDKLNEEKLGDSYEQIAIVFMQITAPGHKSTLAKTGRTVLGVGAAGAFIAPKTTLTAGKGLLTLVKSNYIVAAVAVVVGIGTQQLNVLAQRSATAGYCGDVSIGTSARSGCSVVRAVNYNREDINQYCSVIESIG